MKEQILSFKFAFRGIWKAIKSESHMRFHIVSGFYVMVFSLFYNFSPTQNALLIVLVATVIALETLNTCIEELSNLCADRYEILVRFAKDAAAGAVLVVSLAAVAVGIIFFFDLTVIHRILCFFADNAFLLALLVLSAVVSVIFIAVGPVGINEKWLIYRRKFKNKSVKNNK